MPEWLIITITTVAGLILNTSVTTVVAVLIKNWFKKREDEKAAQDQKTAAEKAELDRLREKENREAHDKALADKLDPISQQMHLVVNGSVTVLRDRMKCSLDYCARQGYATTSDVANWNEMYDTYKKLGGNHFREYVNAWKDEMENLPRQDTHRKED